MSQPVDGDAEPREVDMNKIYVEVVGGLDKKKRMFGVGSLASSLRSEESSGTSHYHDGHIDSQRLSEVEEMLQVRAAETQQLKQALESRDVETEKLKERLQLKDEESKAMKDRLDAQEQLIRQIMASQGLSLPPPPPLP